MTHGEIISYAQSKLCLLHIMCTASASQEKGTFHIPLNGIASHNELEQSHLIVRAIVHNLNVCELQ